MNQTDNDWEARSQMPFQLDVTFENQIESNPRFGDEDLNLTVNRMLEMKEFFQVYHPACKQGNMEQKMHLPLLPFNLLTPYFSPYVMPRKRK